MHIENQGMTKQGIYPKFVRDWNESIDFILYEEPSVNGVTRVTTKLASKHGGLQIGDLVDKGCVPVELATAADAKKIAGISLCTANSLAGLTTQGEMYAVYLQRVAGHPVELKSSYIESLPVKYASTVTTESAKKAIRDAVLQQLSDLRFDFVNTAQ